MSTNTPCNIKIQHATFHARQLVGSFKPLEGTVVVADVVAPTAPPVEPGA